MFKKYAVVKIGGKQLKISEGDTFQIEHQADVKFDVLAFNDGSGVDLGTPLLKDVVVKASVLEEVKSKKVRVARFRAKSRYDKVKGHRQVMSVIKITDISKKGEKKAETVEKADVIKEKTVVKVPTKAKETPKAKTATKKKATVKSSTKVKEK
ncbi:MAG: RplU [uncultured bacterium]|nr:MAG: RplU [uncultured bacterium]